MGVNTRSIAPIGSWIAQHRADAGLSQRGLATRLWRSPQYLSDLERDRREPPRATLRAICDAVGADYDEGCALTGRVPDDLCADEFVVPLVAAFRAVRERRI